MSSYASKQDINQIKTAFNEFVKAVQANFEQYDTLLATYKKSINGIVNGMKSVSNELQKASTSIPPDTIAKINSIITQLNATVDYMESWADAGNVTMKDVRDSVGSRLPLV